MSSEPSIDPRAVEQTKQQIRGLVDEISALSRQNLPPEEYYGEFLRRVVEALAAIGGAVWTIAEGNQLQLAYQINLGRSSLDQQGEHQLRHARLLGQVIQSGEGLLVPPHSGGGSEGEGANPTELLLVLAPVRTETHTEAVIEIFQRPTAQPATRRGYLRFLLQMCELANEWLKTRRLQQYTTRESLWRQVDEFAKAIHETLDLRQTCYTIANEAQRLIECDRVSVAIRRGKRCVVEAVSGQDTFDSRSNVVTLLGQLATKVTVAGDPLWYAGSADDLLPQVEAALHQYVDEAHSKTIAVLPLSRVAPRRSGQGKNDGAVVAEEDPEIIGALIVEQIEDLRAPETLAPRVNLVCGHAAQALSNCLDYNSLFLMPLWRTIGHSRWLVQGRTLPKTVLAAIALLVLAISAVIVPARFDLEGKGIVQPVGQRDVFVETEGVVTRVLVEHGQEVQAGELLLELRNTDLEVKLADVAGQLRSAREQLTSLKRMRHDPNLPVDEKNRVSGQFLQIQQREASLSDQLTLLQEKREQLKVHSPITGQVITWNLERQLLNRPVAVGQVLMTVADPAGDWEMQIFMPENRMGHIADARKELGDGLDVEYIVATDPTTTCKGKVRSVHALAELHEEHGHAVSILVKIDKEDFRDPRPGATATAKMHCGYRSIGYVWLHDVFEFIQSRILFRL